MAKSSWWKNLTTKGYDYAVKEEYGEEEKVKNQTKINTEANKKLSIAMSPITNQALNRTTFKPEPYISRKNADYIKANNIQTTPSYQHPPSQQEVFKKGLEQLQQQRDTRGRVAGEMANILSSPLKRPNTSIATTTTYNESMSPLERATTAWKNIELNPFKGLDAVKGVEAFSAKNTKPTQAFITRKIEGFADTKEPITVVGESNNQYYYRRYDPTSGKSKLEVAPKSSITLGNMDADSQQAYQNDIYRKQRDINYTQQQEQDKFDAMPKPLQIFDRLGSVGVKSMGLEPMSGTRSYNKSIDPVSDALTDITGYGLGMSFNPSAGGSLMGLTNKLGGKVADRVLPKSQGFLNSIGRNAVEGIATTPILSGYESVIQGDTPQQALQRLGTDMALGGAIGGGLAGVGRGIRGIKNIRPNINKALDTINQPSFRADNIRDNYDDIYNSFNDEMALKRKNEPLMLPPARQEPIRLKSTNDSNMYDIAVGQKERPFVTVGDDLNQNTNTFEPKPFESKLPKTQSNTVLDSYNKIIDNPQNYSEYQVNLATKLRDNMLGSKDRKIVSSGNIGTKNTIDNMTAKKYTEQQQTAIDKLNTKHKNDVIIAQKLQDTQDRTKRIKALGMQKSADMRKIIQGDKLIPVEGGLTAKELQTKINKMKTNYKGKEIITPDGEGISTGKSSFGKIEVQLKDNTTKYYDPLSIKPKVDIDTEIARQKTEIQQPITQQVQPPMQSSIRPMQPTKTIQEPIIKPITNVNTGYNPDVLTDTSKLKTNSMRYANWLQDPKWKKVVDDIDADYNVKTDKNTWYKVGKDLESDYEGYKTKLINNGIQNKEDVFAALKLSEDYVANNDAQGFKDFVTKSVRPQTTNIAQMLQGLNSWKSGSIEKLVLDASKMASNVEAAMKKYQPNLYKDRMSKVNNDVGVIDNIVKEEMAKGINLQLFAEKLKNVAKLDSKYVDMVLDLVGKNKYSTDEITDIIKDKYGIPTLTAADTEKMLNLHKEMMKHPETSYEHRKLKYELSTVIPEKMPKSFGDKARGWQAINLFLNLKTMEKILGGNIATTGARTLKETFIQTPLDIIASLKTGKREYTLPNIGTIAKGIGKRAKEVPKDWINNVDTSTFNDSFDYRMTSPFKKGGFMNKVDKTLKAGFALTENTFKQGNYDDILRQQLKVANINARKEAKKAGKKFEPITKPTQEMKDYATNQAEILAFANDNAVTNAVTRGKIAVNNLTNKPINSLLNALGKDGMLDTGKFGLGNMLLPVARTPINMTKWAIDNAPINPKLVTGIIKSIRKQPEAQKELVEGLANGIFGSVLIGAGYKLGKEGMAYASSDKDKDAREFNSERGIQPFSFNIGGVNVTNDWMQPFTMLTNAGTELGSGAKNKNPVLSSAQTLMQQSFIQSLYNMLGGGNKGAEPAQNIANTLLGTLTQAVPFGSAVNQIGKLTDDSKRDTGGDPLKRVMGRIPGLRQQLPQKTNVKGENVPEDSVIDTLFNPSITKTINKDKLSNEMDRLYKQSGEVSQFIPKSKPDISRMKKPIKLTSDELNRLQKDFYNGSISKFNEVINSDDYKAVSDEEKAKMLSSAMTKIKNELVNKIYDNKGIDIKPAKRIIPWYEKARMKKTLKQTGGN